MWEEMLKSRELKEGGARLGRQLSHEKCLSCEPKDLSLSSRAHAMRKPAVLVYAHEPSTGQEEILGAHVQLTKPRW